MLSSETDLQTGSSASTASGQRQQPQGAQSPRQVRFRAASVRAESYVPLWRSCRSTGRGPSELHKAPTSLINTAAFWPRCCSLTGSKHSRCQLQWSGDLQPTQTGLHVICRCVLPRTSHSHVRLSSWDQDQSTSSRWAAERPGCTRHDVYWLVHQPMQDVKSWLQPALMASMLVALPCPLRPNPVQE